MLTYVKNAPVSDNYGTTHRIYQTIWPHCVRVCCGMVIENPSTDCTNDAPGCQPCSAYEWGEPMSYEFWLADDGERRSIFYIACVDLSNAEPVYYCAPVSPDLEYAIDGDGIALLRLSPEIAEWGPTCTLLLVRLDMRIPIARQTLKEKRTSVRPVPVEMAVATPCYGSADPRWHEYQNELDRVSRFSIPIPY